jgi:hypothetical protein
MSKVRKGKREVPYICCRLSGTAATLSIWWTNAANPSEGLRHPSACEIEIGRKSAALVLDCRRKQRSEIFFDAKLMRYEVENV